jgi:hypothetical protein
MRRRSILAQADALEIEGLSAGQPGIDRTPETAVCRLAGMRVVCLVQNDQDKATRRDESKRARMRGRSPNVMWNFSSRPRYGATCRWDTLDRRLPPAIGGRQHAGMPRLQILF